MARRPASRSSSAAASRATSGAALVIDYGHAESAAGETLQAVGDHDFADPLAAPGEVDLTAHVDFQALGARRPKHGRRVHRAARRRAQFLRRLGIDTRAAALKAARRRPRPPRSTPRSRA